MYISTFVSKVSVKIRLSVYLTFLTMLMAYTSEAAITGGTYTVGPTGTYASLTAAMAAYNGGISGGAVILQLQSTYVSTVETFPISIGAAAGASATNTLTIEPAAGASVTITGSNASGILKLNGASYVTINGAAGGSGTSQNLTIHNSNTGTTSAVVWIANTAGAGVTYCSIVNCVLTGNSSATTVAGIITGGTTVTSFATVANSNNTFQNNVISAAEYGILLGGTTTSTETGNIITGNQITTCAFGVGIDYEQSCQITNNTITGITSNLYTLVAAIDISYTSPGLVISGNNIGNVNNTAGAYTTAGIYSASTSTTAMYIYNNYIWNCYTTSGKATVIDNGFCIYLASGTHYYIDDNSMYQGHSQTLATSTNACMYVASGVTNMTIEDNIFDDAETVGSSYGIYSAEALAGYTLIDYNDYVGATGLGYLTSARTTVAAMSTGFGGNTHSISNTPVFTSPSTGNLAMTYGSDAAFVAGTPISTPSITTDIIGTTRSASTPTIGAFEIVVVLNDAAVTNITSTVTCPGSAAVSAVVTNNGTNAISSVIVTAAGCSASPVTLNSGYLLSTPLASGASVTVPLGNYTFVAGPNSITAATSLPNGVTDGNPSNDSKTVSIGAGISGTYTIPGSYATLTAAVAAYNAAPICGPVVFQLTSSYTSSGETFPITINANTGASATNTLTIEPQSSAVTISGGNASAIIELAEAKYVIINGAIGGSGSTPALTITNTNTAATGAVIFLASSASAASTNNTVENCILNGTSSTSLDAVVCIGGATVGSTSISANNNNIIQNNIVSNGVYLIALTGPATGETGNSIIGNTCFTGYYGGLFVSNEINATVSGNTISAVNGTLAGYINGIQFVGTSTGGNIYNNRVSNISNTNATGYPAGGIMVGSSSSTSASTIYNNYISNIVGYGYAGTGANVLYNGNGIVVQAGGGYSIEYNSVYLSNNQTAAGASAALYVYGSGTPVPSGLVIKDNLLINTETTGTAYGLYSNVASTAFTTIDYNDYYVGTGTDYFNNNGTNETSAGAITSGVGGSHSIVALPPFTSTTNLNLTAGGAVVAGTPISGITTDIIGTTRNATTPTIGAFEYVPVNNDAGVTAITSSATCPGAVNVSVTVKNYGVLNLNSVVIWAAGCSLSGTTFNASTNPTLFPIAPGASAVIPVGTYTLVAGINTMTDSTTLPNGVTDQNFANDGFTNTINGGLNGTYSIPGSTFTTLTQAVAAYNAAPMCGPVVFQLTSSYPSTAETFPIVINANSAASSTNTLTIEPATGATPTISGSSTTALIEVVGANNIIFNGSAGGTGTNQNLTIKNTFTGTNTYSSDMLIMNNSAGTVGSTYITVENCILQGSAQGATGTGALIYMGGNPGLTYSGGVVGYYAVTANSNNTFTNNAFNNAQLGMWVNGINATPPTETGTVVTGNYFGSTSSANYLGGQGLEIDNEKAFTVTNNTISGLVTATSGAIGFALGGYITNGTVSANTVNNISSTSASGYLSAGVDLSSSTTNTGTILSNNFISNVTSYGFATTADILYNGHGILVYQGGGYKIEFNSINMATNQIAAGSSTDIYVYGAGTPVPTGLVIENNILANNQTTGTTYSIFSSVTNTAYTTLDYNDYYVGTGTSLGYIGTTTCTTIATLATNFGQNTHSGAIQPNFTSSTNLNLNNYNNFCLASGTAISGITTDIHGNTRVIPDMGADEFNYTFSATTVNNICNGYSNTVTVTAPASTLAAGTSTYVVTYNLSGANTSTGDTAHMSYVAGGTNAGTFSISASHLANSGTTQINITGLSLVTACASNLVSHVVPVIGDSATFMIISADTATLPVHTVSLCSSVGSYTIPAGASVAADSAYTWSTSAGAAGTLSNTNTLTPTYTFGVGDAGHNVTVYLTADAYTPCISAYDSVVITVEPTPAATASNTGSYLPGQTISLSSGPSGQASYAWTGPQGYTASTQNATRTGATSLMSGNYVVTVTNSFGCTDTAITFVSVNALGDYVWTGATSNVWTTVTNWSPTAPVGGPNGCTENVVIPNTVNDPVISSAVSIGNVTINDNATLTLNANLSVCGFLAGGTSAPPLIVGNSHLIFTGSSSQAVSGQINANYLEVNNSSTSGVNLSSTAVVTVNKGLVLTKGNFTQVPGSTVTLVSNASGDAYLDDFTSSTAGVYVGNISVQRYISNTSDGYRDLSTPVGDSKVSDLNAAYPVTGQDGVDCWYAYSPYPNLQLYNEPLVIAAANGSFFMHWMSFTSLSHYLPVMRGLSFRTYVGSPYTISFNGNPNTGAESATITHTTTVAPANDGWNLIGNPYPSPIKWSLVKAMNSAVSASSYYVYNTTAEYAGNWGSWNGTTGVNGATDEISSSQGFFVQTANSSTSFTMNNTVRTTTPGTYLSATHALDNEVRLQLSNNINRDEIVTYTDADATDGYDAAIDAVKMPAGSAVFISYTLADKDYAINAMSQLNVQTVLPLTIAVTDTGSYTLNATTLNTPNLTAYLRDAETGILTDLSAGPITLTLNGNQTYANRYSVVFQAVNTTTGISTTSESATRIYSYGDMVYVKRSSSAPATISVTNVLGQDIKELNSNTAEASFEMATVQPWYAIVKVTEGQKVTVAKVLISNK